MGLTTEEEIGPILFLVLVSFSFRWDGRPNGDFGRRWVGAGRLAEESHGWPSDEETLEIRVDRIEEKPLSCLQFGNEREVCFN